LSDVADHCPIAPVHVKNLPSAIKITLQSSTLDYIGSGSLQRAPPDKDSKSARSCEGDG
jgi:hypothetical protein